MWYNKTEILLIYLKRDTIVNGSSGENGADSEELFSISLASPVVRLRRLFGPQRGGWKGGRILIFSRIFNSTVLPEHIPSEIIQVLTAHWKYVVTLSANFFRRKIIFFRIIFIVSPYLKNINFCKCQICLTIIC